MTTNESSEIKIDKGIPMPDRSNNVHYPWKTIEIGESFLVRGYGNGFSLCAQANRTNAPKVFESRVTDGKARIWRTK
jgi:hypothetical protein